MTFYELAILGDATLRERDVLKATIGQFVAHFGLAIGSDVVVHDGSSVDSRNKHVACAATYFGGVQHADEEATRKLISANVPVIPTVKTGADFAAEIPNLLHNANAYYRPAGDVNFEGLAAAILESVGLLRKQRRVFISYRRNESTTAAMQLHDLIVSRGFDVFLDTHDIRPGMEVQDVIWHRLCDSDVMVMLDTPTYFESRWTTEELGRARAKEIHVLRVVWPGHTPDPRSSFADTIYLADMDLDRGTILDARVEEIVLAIESLRSRSIASRYLSITGRLRSEMAQIGASIEGIGAHRAIAVRLPDQRKIWAYPVVGIPSAELLHDIHDKARQADHEEKPILVYDHVGIGKRWTAHLQWLDENIRAVRALKVSDAGWTLAAWED